MADFCVYLLLLVKPRVEAFQLVPELHNRLCNGGHSSLGLAIHLLSAVEQASIALSFLLGGENLTR